MKRTLCALVLSFLIHGGLFYIPKPSEPRRIETAAEARSLPIRLVRARPSAQKPLFKADPSPPAPTPAVPAAPIVSRPPEKPSTATPVPRPTPLQKPPRDQPKALPPRSNPSPSPSDRPPLTPERAPEKEAVEKAAPAPALAHAETPAPADPVLRPFQELKGGYQVMPVYPLAARRERREGDVLLKVEVLENGFIGGIRVARSSASRDLDAAAIEAVRQWRFEPALQNGEPVRQSTLLPIQFKLRTD